MVKNAILLISILLFMPLQDMISQNKKTKESIINAEYYYSRQKYTEALDFYLMIYPDNQTNHFLNYRIGECYMNMPEKWKKSLPYFQIAAQNASARQSGITFSKGLAPAEAFFRLGEVYQKNNMPDSALKAFLDFKDLLGPSDKTDFEKVNFKIQSIAIAKGMIANPVNVVETNLGPLINTRFSDYNPVLSANEEILIYTSFWESANLIFMSYNRNGEWEKPVELNEQLGSDGSFYTSALSADGLELYLVKEDDFNSDIYVSHFRDSAWTRVVKLNSKINSLSQESSVSVSPDGNTLYFSSNRPGGYGGFDIYYSVKKDGDWDKPVNAGNIINTPYNEEAPVISPEGTSLFFSSQGHRNMGGMDIFYSALLDDGTWSKPQNIGYPINTTGDNLFYVPLRNGEIAYYSKPAVDGFGRNDIYRLEFPFNELLQQALTEDEEMDRINMEIEQAGSQSGGIIISYTVQILALRRDIGTKYFKEFNDIEIHEGSDGLYRYITGNFENTAEARKFLEKVHSYGYRDAFIRTLNSIPGNKNE